MEFVEGIGNKHVGPNIGLAQINKTDLLQHVYTRGTWNRTPDHHLVFTFQVVPRHGGSRKRMRYLTDGTSPGDTAFNVWPVPVTAVSDMPKASAQVHDEIFANDVAQDWRRGWVRHCCQALLSCRTWVIISSHSTASSTRG